MITACCVSVKKGLVHFQLNDKFLTTEKCYNGLFTERSTTPIIRESSITPIPKSIMYIDDEMPLPSKVPVSVHGVYDVWRSVNPSKNRKRCRKQNLHIKIFMNWGAEQQKQAPCKKKRASLEMNTKWPRKKDQRKAYRKNQADYLAKCAMLENYEKKMENTIENLFELYDVSKEVFHNLDPFARLSDKEMHYALKMAA